MLKLEIFAAARGDAILLHHGTEAGPRRMLIDGGAAGTWKGSLQPRLIELGAGTTFAQALPLELFMVSHLDDDHINGILALLRNEARLVDDHEPRTIRPGGLWINVFEELTGSDQSTGGAAAATASLGSGLDVAGEPESVAVVASIPQGRDVRDLARKLNIPLNEPYEDGLVLAGVDPGKVRFGDIELEVLGPSRKRLEDLRKKWDAYLKAKQAKDAEAINKTAAFVDRSIFNLSSTIALVRQDEGKTILLTGDARGDDILEGLDAAGLLSGGTFHVDVLKVPHHGSARNVTEQFFRDVTADDYVICTDGTDDNPDDEMLQMLKEARTGEAYRIWFSYPSDRLDAFVDAAHRAGEIFEANFRDEALPSLVLELA